jgi:hypothetical protein
MHSFEVANQIIVAFGLLTFEITARNLRKTNLRRIRWKTFQLAYSRQLRSKDSSVKSSWGWPTPRSA